MILVGLLAPQEWQAYQSKFDAAQGPQEILKDGSDLLRADAKLGV